jgi:hypothetical protein
MIDLLAIGVRSGETLKPLHNQEITGKVYLK